MHYFECICLEDMYCIPLQLTNSWPFDQRLCEMLHVWQLCHCYISNAFYNNLSCSLCPLQVSVQTHCWHGMGVLTPDSCGCHAGVIHKWSLFLIYMYMPTTRVSNIGSQILTAPVIIYTERKVMLTTEWCCNALFLLNSQVNIYLFENGR